MFAKERVAKFLKRGGPDAVLAEIDKLGDSSYTHRIYYTELARQAELSESLLTQILQRVPAEMSSDYDKATLFTMIAKLPAVTDAHRVQVARAVKNDLERLRSAPHAGGDHGRAAAAAERRRRGARRHRVDQLQLRSLAGADRSGRARRADAGQQPARSRASCSR